MYLSHGWRGHVSLSSAIIFDIFSFFPRMKFDLSSLMAGQTVNFVFLFCYMIPLRAHKKVSSFSGNAFQNFATSFATAARNMPTRFRTDFYFLIFQSKTWLRLKTCGRCSGKIGLAQNLISCFMALCLVWAEDLGDGKTRHRYIITDARNFSKRKKNWSLENIRFCHSTTEIWIAAPL